MIGNNRSTSIPTGGETKFHEHQTMVLWTGCRVESLVGVDHRFLCFERFSFMLGSCLLLVICFAMGVCLIWFAIGASCHSFVLYSELFVNTNMSLTSF